MISHWPRLNDVEGNIALERAGIREESDLTAATTVPREAIQSNVKSFQLIEVCNLAFKQVFFFHYGVIRTCIKKNEIVM